MAIDSASKRASALGVGFVVLTLVVPDAAIAQGDRQTIGHCYSGILATAPVAAPDTVCSLRSIISTGGAGVDSEITDYALGTDSTIMPTLGLRSIIQEDGKGIDSPITSDGISVESKL